jgi:hypothetical protein
MGMIDREDFEDLIGLRPFVNLGADCGQLSVSPLPIPGWSRRFDR